MSGTAIGTGPGGAGALATLRVVEIAGSVAGGYATKLLADQGAVVTKVVGGAEPSPVPSPAMAHYLDRAKSIVEVSEARSLASLIEGADIVIQSSAPQPLTPLANDLPADERRVLVSISPFGGTGPTAGWPSTDLTDQAIAGHLFLNGDPGREPLRGPDHQVAYAAGAHAAIGALAAIRARSITGRGQEVEVTHQQVMAALHQFTLLRYTHNGDLMTRMGNRYAGPGNPAGVYRCGDGLLTLIVPRGDQLESLLAVTGLEGLLDEPGIDGIYDLMHHPTLLDEHLVPWLAVQNRDETIELFQALRIPAAAVSSLADVLADEHLGARGFWLTDTVADRADRTIRTPGPAARLTSWPVEGAGGTDRPSPLDRGRADGGVVDLVDGPLTGLRVIDLTRVWAGPYSTRVLADLGADVIMVEAPWARGGATTDETSVLATRYYPDNEPGQRHWNRIGFANKYNINKRNIAVDLGTTAGVEILEALIAEADVLIENYSPRVMPNFGLDETRLRQLNPALIYVTMPGFGRTGPSRDHVAYGPIVDSQAGLSVLMGYPGETARKAGVAWPDPVAGMHAAFATIAGVLGRAGDGAGRTVEVAQIEATVAVVGHALVEHQLGQALAPDGNRDRDLAPQGVYRCAGDDRWVALSVLDDAGWSSLCTTAGFDESWASWPLERRRQRHDAIDAAIEAWTAPREQAEVVTNLRVGGRHLAVAPVNDAAQVMADPQLLARDAFVTLDHPEAGPHPWPKLPIELSSTPATYRRPGPLLNEHGHEILTTIAGRTDAEVADLARAGVISDHPPD